MTRFQFWYTVWITDKGYNKSWEKSIFQKCIISYNKLWNTFPVLTMIFSVCKYSFLFILLMHSYVSMIIHMNSNYFRISTYRYHLLVERLIILLQNYNTQISFEVRYWTIENKLRMSWKTLRNLKCDISDMNMH